MVETSETEFQPLSSQGSENPKGIYPLRSYNDLSRHYLHKQPESIVVFVYILRVTGYFVTGRDKLTRLKTFPNGSFQKKGWG